MLEIRLLGSFRVLRDGVAVSLTSSRQRALLAALALSAGRVVGIDTLARYLWGDDLPERTRGSLQTYVMRLRRQLGERALVTESDGYRLAVAPEQVDALRFLRLLDGAAERAGAPEERELLGQALGLFARPLEGAGSEELATDWSQRLSERYLFAVERRIDLDVGSAADSELAAELSELIAEHPLRESLWERLIRVLARSGRRAEAFSRYATLRELLVDELGVEPGEPLQRLHRELLSDEREPETLLVPRQLPFDVPRFTGREEELATLERFQSREDAAPILVIEGTAGIGKTSLAVHWAHRVRDRFPGGQFFLDLRGHAACNPVPAEAALESFLRAVGVPAELVPSTVDERSSMLRTRLAEAGVLMLLDNARDAEQVRPLLPGPGNLVIVTSRSQLRGLVAREGAQRLPLSSLEPTEATALLARGVGTARLAAEPEAVAELAELCGRLPLALALAGERASRFAGLSIAGLVGELRDQQVRLDALSDPDDEGTNLRAAFSWSYKALRPQAARMFRLLGLHPGADFSSGSAAALAGTTRRRAREMLDQLASAHLLNQPLADRYQFHDLLRLYAAERLEADEPESTRDLAFQRLCDWYLQSLAEANRQVRPDLLTEDIVIPPGPGQGLSFGDRGEVTFWYLAEGPSIAALIGACVRRGWSTPAWQLAWLLRGFFAERHDKDEWVSTALLAVQASRDAGDQLGLQYAANNLGSAYLRASRTDEALAALEEALAASTASGGSSQTVAILCNLAGVYFTIGELELALDYSGRALETARETGQHTYLAHASLNLSACCISLLRYDEAARHAEEACRNFEQLGDRFHSALALGNVAEALAGREDYADAEEHCMRSLELLRELDADYGTIDVLITLGGVLSATGQNLRAKASWSKALETCLLLHDPRANTVRELLAHMVSAARGDAPHP